jgi:hypothetical protein
MTGYDVDTETEGSPHPDARPLTGGMRRLLLVASVLVFIIGIPLFLLSGQTDRYFAWTISVPLTAAFLGAGYWSSFFIEFVAARERVWANSRVAVPAVFVFTALTLVATLIHLDLFHLGDSFAAITRIGTWTWMAVYVSVPILLAALWVIQLRLPGGDPPRRVPMSGLVRLPIYLLAAGILAVGVALFVAPLGTGVLWPWELTPLTGRAVGAWLIGLGVAAAHMAWERDWRRVLPVSTMFAVFGALELVVLLRFLRGVDWGGARAWIYLLFLLSMLAVGLYGLYASRTPTRGRVD